MKVDLIQVILLVSVMLSIMCIMMKPEPEPSQRTVPNVDFTLNRQLNKSNTRKDEMMHVFSGMEVPGWKWDRLYA